MKSAVGGLRSSFVKEVCFLSVSFVSRMAKFASCLIYHILTVTSIMIVITQTAGPTIN